MIKIKKNIKKLTNFKLFWIFCHFLSFFDKKFSKNVIFLSKMAKNGHFLAFFWHFFKKMQKIGKKWPKNDDFWRFFSLFEKNVSKSAIFWHFLKNFYCSPCSIFFRKKRKGPPLQNPKKGQKSSRFNSRKIVFHVFVNLDLKFLLKFVIF